MNFVNALFVSDIHVTYLFLLEKSSPIVKSLRVIQHNAISTRALVQ